MKSDNSVKQFIERTQKNLEFISQSQSNESESEPNTYEVTQLINSTLGILLFPSEHALDALDDEPLTDIDSQLTPKLIYFSDNSDRPNPITNTKQLIRYIRNAFAHHNVEFENDNHKIKGIYLWNRCASDRKVNWVVYISIDSLHSLMNWMAGKLKDVKINSISKLDGISTELDVPLRLSSREGIE